MKNKIYMRSTLLTGIMLAAVLTITACSSSAESNETGTAETVEIQTEETAVADDEESQNDDTILEENTEAIETEVQEETESVSEEGTVSDDDYDMESAIAAYQEALTKLYEEQIFPGGIEAEYDSVYYDISENQFAVYDIDLDGRDELIILYKTCSMAGMVARIYDYDEDTDSLYSEMVLFPYLTFYDNGVLEEGASHSQGYAGDFWPYTLYVYDSENDTYLESLHADAWDKSLGEIDYYGNAFPEEADEDGDGIVYYLLQPEEYYYNDDPVDWDEYEAWHSATVGNEIEIPYMDLTPENIAVIELK